MAFSGSNCEEMRRVFDESASILALTTVVAAGAEEEGWFDLGRKFNILILMIPESAIFSCQCALKKTCQYSVTIEIMEAICNDEQCKASNQYLSILLLQL
ncbi:hypothetical protein V6N13_115891 [Hibiscus sabdariffa]|uniref:Uncharacterized protein n=1 Tax=Hibiscus sabdariffa TaxID=183260 RepID=A0ABR2CT39_9ROSI